MAPQFRMTYPYARFFPDRGEVIEPDQIIEADENPDGNFFENEYRSLQQQILQAKSGLYEKVY